MKIKKQMSTPKQKQPTKKQMEQVDSYLLYHLPGYRWMKANPHPLDGIKDMDALQSMRISCRLFRYHHLNQMINGNWASEGAKQQRRKRWIEAVKREARMISLKTGVSYDRIFPKLFHWMWEEISR